MPGLEDILGTAGDISQVLAEIAKGRATGRVQEGTANQNQALAEANLYRTQMDAALKGPTQEAQAAAFGDTLSNVQPFQWTGGTTMAGNIPVPQSSGGLNPSNYGPATRAAGASLANQAAGRVTSPSFAMPAVPKLDALPQAGLLDSILNAAGGIGAAGAAAGGAGKSGGDVLGLGKEIWDAWRNRVGGPNQAYPWMPGVEEGGVTGGVTSGLPGEGNPDQGGGGGSNVDPSLATGYDPIAEYEAWLRSQGQQSGGGEPTMQDDWWTHE